MAFNLPTEYYVLDFETEGLDANQHDVIELGLLKVKDSKIIHEWSELISPWGRVLSAKITEITGITDEMLFSKPNPFIAMEKPLRLMAEDGCPIVGHNIVRFDRLFINKYLKHFKLDLFPLSRYIDTGALFRSYRIAHLNHHEDFELPKNQEDLGIWTDSYLDWSNGGDRVKYNVDAMINYLGISRFSIQERHRAVADCKLTQLAFEKLCEEMHLR